MLGYIADDVLARLGSPHHPPERAVPLRAARADARGAAAAGVGRAHQPRGVRRHRAQRRWAATSPARARTRCSTSRPWAEADRPLLLRNPLRAAPAAQVQDQLLRLRHRLRPGDVQRRRRDRVNRAARRTAPSSPASRCSSPAASAPTRTRRRRSRTSPPRRPAARRSRRCLRVFDHYGNRDNKLRARMKWLVDTMGIDELRERILKERKFLPRRRAGRAASPSSVASRATRRRAWARRSRRPGTIEGVAGEAASATRRTSAGSKPTSCAASPTARSARCAYARLGDITADQFRGLADDPARLQRRRAHHQPPELRAPRPHRGPSSPALYDRLDATSAWPSRAPSSPATSSPAPAPTPATSRSRSPRPRRRHRRRARGGRAWPRSAACASTSPAAPTRCGQHHISDIGFFGLERRAHGRAAPGYQMLLGGHVGDMRDRSSARRPSKLPASVGTEAVVRIVGQLRRRARGRRDVRRTWLARSGGAGGVGAHARRTSTTSRPRGSARLLRRLRRDRSVRRRDRRQRVRDMTQLAATSADHVTSRSSTSTSASSQRRRRRARAQARRRRAIEWAWERFGDRRGAGGVVPGLRAHRRRGAGRCRRSRSCSSTRSTTSPETLWYVDRVRSATTSTCAVMQPLIAPDDLWQTDPDECCAMRKGRAARPRARTASRHG